MKKLGEEFCDISCIHEDRVKLARREKLPEEQIMAMADIFKTLGDATRLRILSALMRQELCVCDLASAIEMSDSAVSHQLRVLRSQKLVKFRREGKVVYYSLADEHVRTLFAQGLEHINE